MVFYYNLVLQNKLINISLYNKRIINNGETDNIVFLEEVSHGEEVQWDENLRNRLYIY